MNILLTAVYEDKKIIKETAIVKQDKFRGYSK